MKCFACLALLVVASCAPQQVYIRAERSIYNAIAPEFRGYVQADPKLTATQIERRMRTLEEWDALIREAEAQQEPLRVTVTDR